MPDAPTLLDLDAIRAMLGDRLAVTTRSVALDLLAEVERLRAEVRLATTSAHSASLALGAQLAARPAPAWDEEAVVEGMARAVYPLLFTDHGQPLRVFGEARSDAELREGERDVARERMRQALAVVRDHLPVKPSREDVYRAWHGTEDPWGGCADSASIERALDLLPGRSEAEVKSEALRKWIGEWPTSLGDGTFLADVARDGLARADRLSAEGGADRG